MKMEKSINIQVLGSAETDDLAYETPANLFGHQENDVKNYIYRKSDGKIVDTLYEVCQADGEWISITKLKALFEDFEQKGATHVAMHHHSDHRSYVFDYGVLSVATEQEAQEYQKHITQLQRQQNLHRIALLKAELKRLEKQ